MTGLVGLLGLVLVAWVLRRIGRAASCQYRADRARYRYLELDRIEREVREDCRAMAEWYRGQMFTIEADDEEAACEKLIEQSRI